MTTQREYMEYIKNAFRVDIQMLSDILDAYRYNDHRAKDLIADFKHDIKAMGLKFSNCYHANGIGNNNDYMIFIETTDSDGFVIQKNIASFYYCYGIYGGCYVRLKDLATGEKFTVGRAR